MTDGLIIVLLVVICSLGGWYVVLHKYFAIKAMLRDKGRQSPTETTAQPQQSGIIRPNVDAESVPDDYFTLGLDKHVPGMGPPPLSDEPLVVPPEVMARMAMQQQTTKVTNTQKAEEGPVMQTKPIATPANPQKREVCNWASILHLSGFCLLTGVLFLNIIVPTILWLLKKEQHPYLAKQGREVINFQITLTFLQILSIALGALFIWLFPQTANGLFDWTKTLRILFSNSMYMPFSLFSIVPVLWGCVLMIRGTVAAYNGLAFKYPYAQEFLSETVVSNAQFVERTLERREPTINKPAASKMEPNKINFG